MGSEIPRFWAYNPALVCVPILRPAQAATEPCAAERAEPEARACARGFVQPPASARPHASEGVRAGTGLAVGVVERITKMALQMPTSAPGSPPPGRSHTAAGSHRKGRCVRDARPCRARRSYSALALSRRGVSPSRVDGIVFTPTRWTGMPLAIRSEEVRPGHAPARCAPWLPSRRRPGVS